MISVSLFLIAVFFRQELLTNVGIPSKEIETLSLGRARVGLVELIIKKRFRRSICVSITKRVKLITLKIVF
jgi:hypothetical protein